MTRGTSVRHIIQSFRSGSSWPVLVETSDGHQFVMKWRGTAEGLGAIAADLLALRLAQLFHIPVPTTRILELGADLIDPEQDPELNGLIRRSIGTNLGIEEVADHRPYEPEELNTVPQELRDRIYAFDVLFLNMDRVESNPNMVFTPRGLMCWDFAAMMEMRKLLERRTLKDELFYPLLRRHPFYVSAETMTFRPPAIGQPELEAVVNDLPIDWYADGIDATGLIAGLQTIIVRAEQILQRRLAAIDATPHESPDVRSTRSISNRKAFEETVERLSRRAPSGPGTSS